MKRYKIGIIGAGFIGKVHAYSHLNLPLFYDQSEFASDIVAVCAAHQESADKFAAQTGAKLATTDFRAITENPDIDVVDICTPNNCHLEALLSAMAYGKHIYCDKPLVENLNEARLVEDALPAYKGIAQMTLQNRFFPATLRAKQLMDEGRIGDILEFRGKFLHSGSADPNAPLKWKLSAGTIADLGSHILDFTDYLLGGFTEVMATTHVAFPARPSLEAPNVRVKVTAEDNMMVLARLSNGACGTITASKIATGTQDEFGFEIYGVKGALRWELMNPDQLFFYDATAPAAPLGGTSGWTAIDCGQRYEKPAGFPTPKAPIGWLRGHVHCLWNFMKAVHQGIHPEPGLKRGIYLQFLMEQIKASAEQRRWMTIR